MVTRIRVRKGDTEVEYEGSEQFLKTELASLLQAASTFPAGSVGQSRPAAAGRRFDREGILEKDLRKKDPHEGIPRRQVPGSDRRRGSPAERIRGVPAASPTADIARKIGCKHGTDLVLAASGAIESRGGAESLLARHAASGK